MSAPFKKGVLTPKNLNDNTDNANESVTLTAGENEDNINPITSNDNTNENDKAGIVDDDDTANDLVNIEFQEEITSARKKRAETLIVIKTIRNHSCNIGGKQYNFKAGVRTPVPENVRCVLSRAGLLRG